MNQFESKSRQYRDFVEVDPFRNYLHYPAVLEELGNISDKSILDVGCGSGHLARFLISRGASCVIGYDSSPAQIEEALGFGDAQGLIQYQVTTPEAFRLNFSVDRATSVMVLPYAESISVLQQFFENTYASLGRLGKFVSVVFNSHFDNFEASFGSRRFARSGRDKVKVEFLDPGSQRKQFTSLLHQFPADVYESTARSAGFNKLKWKKLFPTAEGRRSLGDQFWSRCIESQPYSILAMEKS